MDSLFTNILFHIIGRLYLFLRYRSKEKRKTVLAEKHFGSYTDIGMEVILRPIALMGFLLMLVFIAGIIYSIIVHGIS